MNKNIQALAPPLWKLAPLCCVATFFVLLPTSAIPAVLPYFHIHAAYATGLVSWALLGYGLGPLLFAPIANHYGRLCGLYAGFSFAIFGILLSCIAYYFNVFSVILLGRLITGIGTSAGWVIGLIMINDTCNTTQSRRMFSLIILFFALAQSLAMICGGWLSHYLGLGSIFIFMLIIMLALLCMVFSMKETYQAKPIPIDVRTTCIAYFNLIKHKTFMLFTILVAVSSASMYIFNVISPLFAVHTLFMPPNIYGEWAMISPIGLIAGSLFSARLSKRCSVKLCIWMGLMVMTLATSMMLIMHLYVKPHLLYILLPAAILFFGAALVFPNASISAIRSVESSAHASSVMSSLALLCGSTWLQAGGYLFTLGDVVLPLILLTFAFIGIVLFFLLPASNILQKSTPQTT